VTNQAMAGVFKMIAVEEKNIRTNLECKNFRFTTKGFLQCKTKSNLNFYAENYHPDSLRRPKGIIAAVTDFIVRVEGILFILTTCRCGTKCIFYALGM